jgi:hypothetical protein
MLRLSHERKRVRGVARARAAHTAACPSSFILHPSSFRPGISLIEVLASIGVISIGLLGLASLLPVGLVSIFEATKSDRAGNCGRAAMREIVVRRMLDYHYWYDPNGGFVWTANYKGGSNYSKSWYDANGNPTLNMPPSFILDPLGVASGGTSNLGSYPIPLVAPRITLASPTSGQPYTPALADTIFRATDDIIATAPENMTPAQPPGRPVPMPGTLPNTIASQGNYSWFASVTPSRTNPSRFEVSVVVCYRRAVNPMAEQAVPVKQFYDTIIKGAFVQGTNGVGGSFVAMCGGDVQLQTPVTWATGINIRENDWVALCNKNGTCRWYQVVAVGDDPTALNVLTLSGPDWPYATSNGNSTGPISTGDMLIALGQDVIGVYTTTVDVDTDATWTN